eukprot:COSAG02_NODE_29584_length_566_cov_1.385439_2_plen_24_part_01
MKPLKKKKAKSKCNPFRIYSYVQV